MSAGALEQLASEVGLLRDELSQLKQRYESPVAGLTARICSLDPEPFTVISPIEVVIRQSGDGYLATFFDANINASGDTDTEAFENLKDMIVATMTELVLVGADRLGLEPTRQLAVLSRFVRPQKDQCVGSGRMRASSVRRSSLANGLTTLLSSSTKEC